MVRLVRSWVACAAITRTPSARAPGSHGSARARMEPIAQARNTPLGPLGDGWYGHPLAHHWRIRRHDRPRCPTVGSRRRLRPAQRSHLSRLCQAGVGWALSRGTVLRAMTGLGRLAVGLLTTEGEAA